MAHFMCTALTSPTLMTTCGVMQGREIWVLTCNKWLTFPFVHTLLICKICSSMTCIPLSDIWLILNTAHLSGTLHGQCISKGWSIHDTEYRILVGKPDLGTYKTVILEWSQGNKQGNSVWTRSLWLSIGLRDGTLCPWYKTLRFHKIWGIFWLAEHLSVSKRTISTKLFTIRKETTGTGTGGK
jgi:hypothetical protein